MALAWLEPDPGAGTGFRFELGRNRFYRYLVGTGRRTGGNGIETVADPLVMSPLLGPLGPEALGRGHLEPAPLPAPQPGERHWIQLESFRERDLAGPAISPVLPLIAEPPPTDWLPPPPSFGLGTGRPSGAQGVESMPATIDRAPFRYREASYSNAMFLGALGGILTSALPHLGGLLGGLFGGGGGGGAGGGGAAAPASGGGIAELIQRIATPDNLKKLGELLQQVTAASGGAAPQAKSLSRGVGHGPARRNGHRGPRRPLDRCRPEYSQAQVAPALLAALPALMPLLQQVLNPQTVQTLVDAPNKHLGTVINGVLDLTKLGMENQEKFREHLRALNPGVDDPALDQLIASVSQSLALGPRPLDYARVSSVHLTLAAGPPVSLLGADRLVYRHGVALEFPVQVETPQPIPQAVLQLEVKDARTLQVARHKRYRVEQVTGGPLLTVPSLTAEECAALAPGHEYLVCLTLAWKNRRGERRGTSQHTGILVAGACTFDRVEETSELIPLADPDRFRDYWHKVWEGGFEELHRIALEARYYYVLAPERHRHAQLETRSDLTAADRRLTGRVKSGMELSPAALNQLGATLRPEGVPLGAEELEALTAPGFAERFHQAARYRAEFRGREGDRAALWVYPEVKLQRIVLAAEAGVDAHGQVTAVEPREIRFPVPALVHFIGARSA